MAVYPYTYPPTSANYKLLEIERPRFAAPLFTPYGLLFQSDRKLCHKPCHYQCVTRSVL